MTTVWHIPRESVEWVGPITVTANGTPTNTFDVAYLAHGLRPEAADWVAPYVIGTERGVLVSAVTATDPDRYTIWARVTANPEVVVLNNVATVWRT